MTQKRQMIALLLSGALLGAAAPARAVVQEYQTLELVRTYNSEEEVQAAYPELKPHRIVDDGEYFSFFDPETKTLRQKIKKEELILTEQEQQTLDRKTTIVKQGKYYTMSEQQEYLIVTGFTATIHNRDLDGRSDIQRKTLYNAYGDAVAELPLDAEFIEPFPDHQHLLAFNLGDDPDSTELHTLYFYATDGTLLTTHDVQGRYEQITFSKNGQFLGLFRHTSSTIGIFTSVGNVIYEGKYTNFIQNNKNDLYRLFLSDDGQTMLLDMFGQLYLCTTSGTVLWKQDFSIVTDAWFFHKQQKLLMTVSNQDGTTYDAFILSLHDGVLIEKINQISAITMVQDHLLIVKEGVYYEYTVN